MVIMKSELENIIQRKYSKVYSILCNYNVEVNEYTKKNIVNDICNNVLDIEMFFDDLFERLEKVKNDFETHVAFLEKMQMHSIDSILKIHRAEIDSLQSYVNSFYQSFILLKTSNDLSSEEMESKILDFYAIYRYLLSSFANISNRLEWQSISYESSKRAQIYRSEELGYKGILGYKRVHYPALISYEKDFVKEFFENNEKNSSLISLMTNSGQGAFLTIREMIAIAVPKSPSVLLSPHTYYETRTLVSNACGWRSVFFECDNESSILQQVQKERPDVLMLEPYYCSETVSFLDVHFLVNALNNIKIDKKLYVVIDSTMMSGAIQPFNAYFTNPNVEVILFESMIKYREFGIDRVNAGFVVAPKKFLRRLINSRAITGTILDEISLNLLPRITKSRLTSRMNTIYRNALYISQELQKFADNQANILVEGIEFPGIPSHKDYQKFQKSRCPYLNGIINLKFDKDYYSNFATMLFFISKVIEDAKDANISISHGTSFGFDHTRLAVADSSGGEFTYPFIRISVGRENFRDIVILTKILKNNIQKYLKY